MKGSKLSLVAGLIALASGAPLSGCATPSDAVGPGLENEFGVGGDRPPSARTLHSMSRVLAVQGRDGQCEIVLHKLIAEEPCFLPAYLDLAELHLRNGDTQGAVEVLELALGHGSEDPIIQNDLGMAYVLDGRYEQAVGAFETAIALAPEDARARGNLGAALGMLGRYDEALAAYLEVVQAEDAHYNVGVLAEARGDAERAALEFRLSEKLRR